MELRHLRYFTVVAAEEHFRNAAERLNIAQPALSQQIRQLEDQIGVALFERIGRGVRLTEAGKLFWDYADRILALSQESIEAVQEIEGLTRGRLNLGIAQTPNSFHAAPIISAFKARFPHIFVSIAELSADEIETQLVKGELDLGVSFTPGDSQLLDSEPLFEESFALIAAPNQAIARRSRISLKTLQEIPLALLTRDYCTRRLFEKTCDDLDLPLKVSIEMNTIEGILGTLEASGLATVLPEQASRSTLFHAHNLRAIPIQNPGIRRTVGLLYRKSGYLSPAAREMAELWRNAASPKV
ncbi:LysR substrate-binding domain-containing protein [Pelagicoccus sp. SDUM812003]|uniref:LysR substrate-binding domain-containing protein n=1 Tax=Pelagicoccus sp. SDUM812003 TaxID=3041267 RepID=UPI00280D7B21|nr:LysR substrate-binding domain-containing protein [Pelagicoccus sp. SDUM812003]MDQ8205621.1 LysR substrate-binding domain-containing protein [Pelagicoccus sp. SDUM812003]